MPSTILSVWVYCRHLFKWFCNSSTILSLPRSLLLTFMKASCYYFRTGREVQKLSIIRTLSDLVETDGNQVVERVMPLVQVSFGIVFVLFARVFRVNSWGWACIITIFSDSFDNFEKEDNGSNLKASSPKQKYFSASHRKAGQSWLIWQIHGRYRFWGKAEWRLLTILS